MNFRIVILFIFLLDVSGTYGQGKDVPVIDRWKFIERNDGLRNASYCVIKKKEITVAFLGGSITHMKGWRDKVSDHLTKTFPATKFRFIEAGIPSLGSVAHSFRLKRDLLSKGKIDLVFVESAVNDRGTKEETERRALEGIIRSLFTANPYLNIIMMAFVDESKIADYNNGIVPLEVKVHQDIARYYKIPFINLAKEVTDRINNNEFTWKKDFKNLHPSPFGQELYARTIGQLLDSEFSVKPLPEVIVKKLPVPMDSFNYSNAGYVDNNAATKLKGFNLVQNWQPSDSFPTRPGYVNIPVLEGVVPGSSFELSFTGRTVGLGVISGPDAGKISISIDGGAPEETDLFINASKDLHLPYYIIVGDKLKDGKHLLKLRIGQDHNFQSKGTACRIAYFLVNKTNTYFEDWPLNSSPGEVGSKVANRFILTSHTNYNKPAPPKYITYPEVCTWYGALAFAGSSGDKELKSMLEKRFDTLLKEEAAMIPVPLHVDYAVFGALPLELYIQTKKPVYRALGKRFADAQWEPPAGNTISSSASEYFNNGYSWMTRMWIDDMYMITVLQCQAYRATNEPVYIERAAKEMVTYLDSLQRPNGLFFHAPDVPFFWGRGNGWMAAGMTELLRLLPENNPDHNRIMQGYKKMMNALLACQDANGLWRQLIDDKASWTETSGSGMFTFAFITGVKKGWLDPEKFGKAARNGWLGLVASINEDGNIRNVCEGTNKLNDRQYYLNRKGVTGDLHGQAPVLWCANALLL